MPIEFRVDPAARVVRSRAWGEVLEADLAGHAREIRALFAAGALDTAWAQLVDFRDVTDVARLPSTGVRRMAQLNPWPPGALRVFVASQAHVHGLLRMYIAHADAESLHIVTSHAEAHACLAAHGHGPAAGAC